ncbi:unnamed protein product, partial [Sphagnum tenellum]
GTKLEEDTREKLLLHQEEEDESQQVVEDEDSEQQSLEKKEKKEAEEEQHEQQDTLTVAPDLPLPESLHRRDDEEDVLNLDSESGKEQQLDVQKAPGTAGSWYGIGNFRSDTPTSPEANCEDQKGAKSDAPWGKNFFFGGRKAEGHVFLELEALRSTVHRLHEKEKQLESQILEFKRRAEAQASTLKDLQEKETGIAEKVLEYRENSKRLREREETFLDRQQEKDVEIMELRSCLEALELQGKHQALEISAGENVKNELDEANARVEELQKQVHTNVEQENAKLLLMQEKVSMLETQCEEQGSKIVELRSHLEAVELQRMNQALEISASESLKKKELDEAHAMGEELQKEMQTNAEQANADLALMTQKVSMLETQCEEGGNKIVELGLHLEAAESQRMLEISASENVKKELDEAHARVKELQKEMQANAEQANTDLALMKQKVSMLETQCEEEENKIVELNSHLETAELQRMSEISASENVKKELDEAHARVKELQKEMQTNAEQANDDLALMKQKVSMLETQCQEEGSKIAELTSHLEAAKLQQMSEISASENVKKELDPALARVKELQKEMQTNAELANADLALMKQKVSMLETQCEEEGSKIVELNSHLEAAELQRMSEISASENVKKELDEAHAKVKELQKEMQTNAEQANDDLALMKQKVSMLETQCEAEGSKIVELRSHLEAAELQRMSEISASENVKKELDEAHARVKELQKEMQTNAEQANADLALMKQKVSMLETQCEEEGSKIVELNSHLEAAELQRMWEISTSENVKKELDEAHANVKELQKEMQTNAEQANDDLALMKQKVSMLETQCEAEGSKIVELRLHLEAAELQRISEISASENVKKELDEAHARVKELQKEMQTNAEQANADLALMKQKVSMLETQCEEEGSKIVELNSHLEAAELQRMWEISTSENVKKELDEAHARVKELQKEMQTNAEQANDDLALMKQKVSMLETQCEAEGSKVGELTSHLEAAELQRLSEISASENVKKELDEAHARVKELQKEMQTNAEQANADLALMKQKVSMLETQCEEEGSKIVELKSHLEAAELQRMLEISASENVKKELDEAHARVKELQKEMQTNAEQANADLALMKQKVSMLETQCEEEGGKIVELNSHLEAAELQRMLEISASENVKKELDEAHARVKELQKEMQTNAEQANADLALMKQKVSMLETQCEAEGSKIVELRSHLEAAELQRMSEISASENVKKELDEAHARVKELQKEMQTNAEQANDDLALMEQKVSMLETQCEAEGSKVGELTSHLEASELQRMSEISARENVKKELDEAHARVQELQKEMQTNAEQANDDLALMKQKVSMLETQCEAEGSKVGELTSHLEASELQRMSEISASENVKKELDEAHARVKELQKEMQTNAEQANDDLALMKEKISMLETQCEGERSKIAELRSHLEAAELQRLSEISASENVKKELDEAHARVKELQKEMQTNAEQANADLALMKQKVSMLETKCEEEGSKLVELRSHLEAAELQRMSEISASENVKKELDEAHARVKELQKEMQTNAEQANADLALMKQKVSMLETKCEEEGSKIVELRSHLEAAELQRMSEISASENVKKELDEAHARVKELQKEMQTNAEQANADLALMKQKVSMLETQCDEEGSKIGELRSHLEAAELQRMSEISASENVKKELDEAHARVKELQKEMQTNAEQANDDLALMKQKVSMLETQSEEEGSKIVKLRSHLEAAELQRMSEISASENVKKELDEAHARVKELQKEMQTNAEQANADLALMKQKVSMLETKCEEEGSKIVELRSHLEAAELQRMSEISASENVKKELDEAHARVKELQKEMQTNAEQANNELTLMKHKVSMLETQCQELHKKDVEIIELRSCLEGLELQIVNHASEISASEKLRKELDGARARVEELQKELRSHVEQANVELSMTKHKVSMLETQCEEKGWKIEELGSHLASLELQNRNQALEISEVQELKKELEEAHVAMVEELQKEMQTNVEQANVELSMTKQKVSMLETQCQEKKCKIEELGSHLEGLELQSKNQTLEIFARQKLQKELEEAHGTRIEELQKEMQTNVEQANAKLSMTKQKVSMLETQLSMLETRCEEEKSKKDMDIQSNMYFSQEMEGEVVGLRHTNKELEQQKIELTERLLAAEIRLTHHFEMEKEDHDAKPKENIVALRHVNEDLIKQVEGLQSSRFSEVEELVYLRWVNACLRHELRNHQTTLARVSALDLNKSSSPESVEKAKQLMLEYIGSDLVALQAKDHIDMGDESSFSEKSFTFSENNGDDNDIPFISGHIPRKQSFIRRLRNWTTRHLEVGTNVSSNFVSPLESEKWSQFHSDPKHRQQNIIGTKVPKETTTHIHRHASDMTLNKETTTNIHKHASDMTSIGITSPMGGKKFDANAMKSSSAYPRRTTSDSIVLDGASLRSDHVSPILKKPNLPPLETTIMEDDDNPLNGLVATATLQPMARSLAFKIGENPSIKDKHIEARDREQKIKEKAKGERERIRKEKMQARKAIELQPSTPQQLEGMSLAQVEKTTSKIMPKPPPKPLGPSEQHDLSLSSIKSQGPPLWNGIPTPSPPYSKANSTLQLQTKENNMQRVPEVAELYMSLMKNEDGRENENQFFNGSGSAHDVHNNTINGIDDRSTHRWAIKADVETLGEFVQTLATEVRMAIYYNIEDVVAFINWLDEELSVLVDETAVLKHFDWPQGKVDALREAAFEYLDLTKLQEELSLFEDTPQLHYEEMFKNMLTLLEKVELSVNGFLRTRDMEVVRYQEFHIPIEWMLDSGVVGKIKQESVKLAHLYINKVLLEVDRVEENAHKEPMQEFILLQGVRFAFRVHQFAGGFDAKSMKAFEALRDRAHVRSNNSQ